jgi:hypothetical protein
LAEKTPFAELQLKRLQPQHLSAALDKFDFPLLGDQEMALLYEATGGRLDLLHDFTTLARDCGPTSLGGDKTALYGQMIERRLRSIKGDVSALEGLLSAASFLGGSFSPEEASCLTGYAMEDVQAIMRQAEDENFLAARGGCVSFPSVAMQRYFLSSRIANPAKYHGKFAECLRRMRPGDYEARSQHLFLAGQTDNALVCHCLAFLDARRRKRVLNGPVQLRGVEGWQEYASYLELMLSAYSAHDRDALAEGLITLESIETFLPEVLIAERDYLEAQIRMKSPRVADIERVVALLQKWLDLKEAEPEVWSRIAQTLMVALSETDHHEDACQLEGALTKYYGSRRTLDPWALYGLNCLRRQSECLHHLVPSRNRLQSALAYFGPTASGTLPRHPLQFYYTLTNLVANLIANGLFAEARVRGVELERLVQNHASFDWPCLEIAANNSILASYLANVLPLRDAMELMGHIDDGRIEIGDRLLIQNNLAVLLVHGGKIAEAQEILTRAWAKLGGMGDSDVYHRYFVANNLAGLAAVNGDTDHAIEMLEEAGRDLHRLYPAIRETLLQRHAMMSEPLRVASRLGAKKFDCFLKDNHAPQVGPQWEFYGRGFLLSDIQFWTSD